ncbi:MAG: prepilin-type N-terminal cleavage/methylation domain-containing protein [Gammaproteobacteria bacterium]|nr:prepilin-type N-terminal cleavage/methylation domain-containing protein [Gammaproteobacteria bacterium]
MLNRRYQSRQGKHSPVNTAQPGFSVLEILIVIAILAILISIAIPAYENYQDKKNNTQAKSDILELQVSIDRFYIENNRFPDNLQEINQQSRKDPWGNFYYYTNITTATNKGSVRKDKNLTPVNSDYDLYSAGKDRSTSLPFTAQASLDDIVRCNNGSYIGFARDY